MQPRIFTIAAVARFLDKSANQDAPSRKKRDTAVATSYATLTRSEKTDVAVVGPAFVGLTAAYSLIRAGLSVTVLGEWVGRMSEGEAVRGCVKLRAHEGTVVELSEQVGEPEVRSRALERAPPRVCGLGRGVVPARSFAHDPIRSRLWPSPSPEIRKRWAKVIRAANIKAEP